MHVLTKIFIVLVSLLAVLLVPLVVVYAHNENSFKNRVVSAEARAVAANEALSQEKVRAGAELSRAEGNAQNLQNELTKAQTELASSQATINQLQSQLAAANATHGEIMTKLATIATSVSAGQQLNESLVTEVRSLRTEMVAIEKERVQLDEALRDVTTQLEVAQQARRALQEELARLKDDHTKAMTQLGQAIAEGFGTRNDVRAGSMSAPIPDVSLTATIIRVERSNNQVLAEIDAGSRSGVKMHWEMPISSGGNYIGKLQIISVDVNRATGKVVNESKERGLVQVGQTVSVRAGER